MDLEELTYQQKMVWERLENVGTDIVAANTGLAARAAVVLGGSSAAAASVSLVLVLPDTHVAVVFVLVFIAMLSLFSLWLAGLIWRANDTVLPGTDIDVMYEEYINQEVDEAYGRGLIDMGAVIDCETERNELISRRLRWMILSFQAQIFLLVVAIILHTLTFSR